MRKLVFFVSIAILSFASCSQKEDMQNPDETQIASMTIKIVGDNQTRAVGNPTQTEENTIYGYKVYVFYNGVLEKVTPLITSGLTQTLQGLTTGAKKVVVVANPALSMPDFFVGDPYSKFAEEAFNVNLENQSTRSNGLIMTGQVDVILAEAPATNAVTIPVSRIVAKIKLGTITLDPVVGVLPELFSLQGVAIMDAPSFSSLGLPSIVTTPPLYGGLEGAYVTGDAVKTWLFEEIALDDHDNRYFYVFADDATMLTLVGTYNGTRGYFVFKIDPINRNTQHTLNITLKRLGSGSPSPDIPSDPTTMDVTIVPENWQVIPTQYVIW